MKSKFILYYCVIESFFFERLSQTHLMFSLTSTSLLRIHFEASEKQVENRYDSQLDVLNMSGQLEPHPPRLAYQTLPLQEGRVWYNVICGFVPAAKNVVGQLDCRIMSLHSLEGVS